MAAAPTSAENALLAFGTLAAGFGAIMGIVLVAQGRQRELYPFAVAAAVTTSVIGASRVLGGQSPLGR